MIHQIVPGLEEQDLQELELLALSAGAAVIGKIVSKRKRVEPATFIGKGKAEEIRDSVQAEDIDLILFNHDLSPIQERNLERIIQCRVLDRAGLILDIFAQRAQSHEGKLQVELAQLEHLSTRLVRGWTHLERQKGGIGLRGPGETQLETDRRLIRDRIKQLNKKLAKVHNQRRIRRKSRKKVPIPTVSLVGYTNAGKSSLFNALTGAQAYVADQLFATLDPTMRRLDLVGKQSVILADTVGFVRHLPHKLVDAFHSTLEEVVQADLLLHVVDASNPDAQEQLDRVNEVLEEIGAEDRPQIIVYNKIDLSSGSPRLERNSDGHITKLWVSAKTGVGLDQLLNALSEHYRKHKKPYRLMISPKGARLRAGLYERLDIQSETPTEQGGWCLDVNMDEGQVSWLAKQPDKDEVTIIMGGDDVLAPTGS